MNAKQLTKKYGTPLFVYDTAKMRSQYMRMKEAFDFPHHINYSCKSLAHPAVLAYFNSLGAGLDTVSYEQVQLGLKAGFAVDDILFTPSGTSFERIRKVADLGVVINFGNVEQLEQFAQAYPKPVVFLRFNPDLLAGATANVSVGHNESKFGIHVNQLSHVKKIVDAYDIKVIGLHVHTGSDILDANKFIESCQIIFDIAKHFKKLKYINLGSGFKVKYSPSDEETNIEAVGEKLGEKLQKLNQKLQKKISLIVEPGKFLVSDAGVFYTHVNVIKQTPTATFAFVNSGFNHMVRPMYYNAYHYISNISNPKGNRKLYNVVGYLGETDTFAWNRKLPEISVGDILEFHNAGAYGYSMASNYNSRPKPAEVLIHEDQDYLITRRESLEDLTHLYQDLPIDFENEG